MINILVTYVLVRISFEFFTGELDPITRWESFNLLQVGWEYLVCNLDEYLTQKIKDFKKAGYTSIFILHITCGKYGGLDNGIRSIILLIQPWLFWHDDFENINV